MDETTILKAKSIIKDHPNSILIMTDETGQLVDRVMWTARVDDDMTVHYATNRTSPKVRRIGANPKVLVMWIGSGRYVSLRGTAVVTTDAAVLDDLWRDSFRGFFPGGKTDPNYAVIKVTPGALSCEGNCDAAIDVVDLG